MVHAGTRAGAVSGLSLKRWSGARADRLALSGLGQRRPDLDLQEQGLRSAVYVHTYCAMCMLGSKIQEHDASFWWLRSQRFELR
jgi:hypothetical protein